jgi:excisionase family DNA binding protein
MAIKLILVSQKDAARLLSISGRSVQRYISCGVLPSVRVGRRTMLRSSDLLTFAQNGVSTEKLRDVMRGVGA